MDRFNKDFVKINIEYDEKNPKSGICEVKGSEVAIISAIGAIIRTMIEKGLDVECLEYAIEKAVEDGKMTLAKKKNKIKVHEISLENIDREDAEALKNLLKKITKEEE